MKATSDVVRRKFTPKEVMPSETTATAVDSSQEKKLASEINRTAAINFQDLDQVKIVDSTENSGFYCKDCNLSFKDSVSFLDHLNSRLHQRNLGIEMRVEKSSYDQVFARIEHHKKKTNTAVNVTDLVLKKMENAENEKISKRNLKKQRIKLEKLDKLDRGTDSIDNSDIMESMGFSNFK